MDRNGSNLIPMLMHAIDFTSAPRRGACVTSIFGLPASMDPPGSALPRAAATPKHRSECAVKAAIAKQTRRYDFPDKQLANQSFTHDLKSLLQTAGLWPMFESAMRTHPPLGLNWAVAKDWNEGSRYILSTSEAQTRDLYSACTARTHGLLSWLKNYW